MSELLLELYSEEIPARMQGLIAEELKDRFQKLLGARQINAGGVEVFYSPRRIALLANSLPKVLPAQTIEKRGPRVGAEAKALEGFLKSTGLKLADLEKRTIDKNEFYFAVQKKPELSLANVLQEIIEEILPKINLPKSMKWGNYEMRWVRPLKNILCLFDGKIVPVKFFHLEANNQTFGHFILHNKPLIVENFKDYQNKLTQNKVIYSQTERRKIIVEGAKKIASKLKLTLLEDADLIDEIVGLNEFPNVAHANIDSKYMHLPKEVLISSIKKNQKYLCLVDDNNNLAPYFIYITNVEPNSLIEAGNKRVLKARLEDAKFFFEQDKKIGLSGLKIKLSSIIFHQKLGSLEDKGLRVKAVAKFLSIWVPNCSLELVERVAEIYKCDLLTEVVKEFPELQGIMGYYYSLYQKEDSLVALAIKEHYRPANLNDAVPTNPISVAIAIADKVDFLVSLYVAGEKPTSSGDPFALRRMAIGIIKILLINKISIPLNLLIEQGLKQLPKDLIKESGKTKEELTSEIIEFVFDRLKYLLKNEGLRADIINACVEPRIEGGEFDLFHSASKTIQLSLFLKEEQGKAMLQSYKRAHNILKSHQEHHALIKRKLKESLLIEPAEQELFKTLKEKDDLIDEKIKNNHFYESLEVLSTLTPPVNVFFDKVLINADDEKIKENRYLLTAFIVKQYHKFANFSLVED